MDVTEEFDLDSDHWPIVLTLSETIIKKKDRNTTLSNKLTGTCSEKTGKQNQSESNTPKQR